MSLGELFDDYVDPAEAHALGLQFIHGDAGEVDYEKALVCLRYAAASGHAEAQNDLGTMLRNGLGCGVDLPAAIDWYERAAAQGVGMAHYNLGTLYLHGVGGAVDPARARACFERAMAAGVTQACCDLGTLYRFGHGTARDLVKAAGLHLQAAHAGDVVAIGNLADYYEELVPLALRGDLDASRALHQVYGDGYGPSPDAARAWAWMRWAHDGCLPQRVATRGDDTGEAIARDYAAALQATAVATRRAGDASLGRLLAENGINVTGNWQPLLKCGAEGGSVTLLGRWAPDGWRYRADSYDCSLMFLDEEEEGAAIETESAECTAWKDALAALDARPWHRLYCVHIHPEFRARIARAWRARCAEDPGAPEGHAAERWRRCLRRSP